MKKETLQYLYETVKNPLFFDRYFDYQITSDYLENLPSFFHLKIEGYSVLNRSIYSVQIGRGSQRILIWSQMHGNESTTTKALMDFLEAVKQKDNLISTLLERCCIKIIPVLNPDGAVAYTRFNANQIDLNRDALNRTQPEIRLLQEVAEDFKPDFCYNMHDQRTIFGVGQPAKPTTLSFLAPASDPQKSIGASRRTAMQIIAGMNELLQQLIPGQVGRYDDTFNGNCIGDFFQAKNIPTILFEAGHYSQDYQREITRRYVFMAFLGSLNIIANKKWSSYNFNAYFKIPENEKPFCDILIKNVKIKSKYYQISVQYEEKLTHQYISFVPKIYKITTDSGLQGHREIDANYENIDEFAIQPPKRRANFE